MLFLDISMPPYEDKGIYSGEDLEIAFRIHADCKIILLDVY
jgi:hypothetical protein